jgi:hypothetical protein
MHEWYRDPPVEFLTSVISDLDVSPYSALHVVCLPFS